MQPLVPKSYGKYDSACEDNVLWQCCWNDLKFCFRSSDLEAASKARSKLSTSSSSADNKTIAELHTQLIQLEGVSEQLPALTARLQQLAHLHVNAANFSSRLSEAEKSLVSVQSSLESLEITVGKMEQGLVENLKTMDANLKALESRLS